MVSFTAILEQYTNNGEKTGWTFVRITEEQALQLMPGNRKSFRVKGKIDAHTIKGVALMPIGNGEFILPVNSCMRKIIGKKRGASVKISLTVDKAPLEPSPAFRVCLDEDEQALRTFNSLSMSQRNYYIKWVDGVKKEDAVAKRIGQALDALAKGMDFVAMMQYHKTLRN